MKKLTSSLAFLLLVVIVLFSLTAYCTGGAFGDILAELGLEKKVAEDYIRTGFLQGKLISPRGLRAAHQWNTGKRKEALREIASLVKGYTASEEFKKLYLQSIMKTTISEDDYAEMKMEVEALKGYLQQLEAHVKKLADKGQELDEVTKSNLKAIQDKKQQIQDYERMKTGTPEPGYATVQGGFIARRLQEFLDLSSTVDYEAKLQAKGNKMVFQNNAYENKPESWKKCFRAGKELTEEARTICREWIAELKVKPS